MRTQRKRHEITIAGRKIGTDYEPYIICELSGNHGGDLSRALKLIETAADTGADAIKIQSYTADTITIDYDGPGFRIETGLWAGRTLYELYGEACTPFEWHELLFKRARELGITIFSTPFDETAVDLLETLDAPAYKIASFEVVDLPLIAYVASKRKPIIISTGMCTLGDIDSAVRTARGSGCRDLILLHCVSSYPAVTEDSNVRTVSHLAETFGCVSGLSDHTLSPASAIASIAVGGSVIEKHFTLSRNDGGPDAAFSLEPSEFTELVELSKSAWRSLGSVNYDLLRSESSSVAFRRSLYIVQDISQGELLTRANVRSIRPGHGLAPQYLSKVLGRSAVRDLRRGEPLAWDMVT